MSLFTKSFLMAGSILLISACASKPPQYETLAAANNPATEIERTQEMLDEARQKQYDVLAPRSFTDAEKALDKAKSLREKGKPNADILEQVSYSRGWIEEANNKAAISLTTLADIQDARRGAIEARAPELLEKEWKRAETDLKNITYAVEKGSLSRANKNGADAISHYRDLETKAVHKANLGAAKDTIKQAEKDQAAKKAPVTYQLAKEKLANAESIINSDPRNSEAILSASQDASREANHLRDVVAKVKEGNTEDLVLRAESQQRQLSSLKNEYSSTEQELAASRAALSQTAQQKVELEKSAKLNATAEELRRSIPPKDAEVFTEAGKLTVRLKGVQFASGKTNLGPKSKNILGKVTANLKDTNASKITIEGHTDSTGSADKNMELSEKRAEAVQKFMAAQGLEQTQMEAVGLGSDKPISENNSSKGRAQNRRIDIVIE